MFVNSINCQFLLVFLLIIYWNITTCLFPKNRNFKNNEIKNHQQMNEKRKYITLFVLENVASKLYNKSPLLLQNRRYNVDIV